MGTAVWAKFPVLAVNVVQADRSELLLQEALQQNQKLREKARESENHGMCVVCREKKANVLTFGCRHVCMCSACCSNLQDTRKSGDELARCPICRECVQGTTCIFWWPGAKGPLRLLQSCRLKSCSGFPQLHQLAAQFQRASSHWPFMLRTRWENNQHGHPVPKLLPCKKVKASCGMGIVELSDAEGKWALATNHVSNSV